MRHLQNYAEGHHFKRTNQTRLKPNKQNNPQKMLGQFNPAPALSISDKLHYQNNKIWIFCNKAFSHTI